MFACSHHNPELQRIEVSFKMEHSISYERIKQIYKIASEKRNLVEFISILRPLKLIGCFNDMLKVKSIRKVFTFVVKLPCLIVTSSRKLVPVPDVYQRKIFDNT